MKVALGVVSPNSALITDVEELHGKTLIVSKGTTAETYFTENHPEVTLVKFDTYTEAFNALIDGRGDALSTDNTTDKQCRISRNSVRNLRKSECYVS